LAAIEYISLRKFEQVKEDHKEGKIVLLVQLTPFPSKPASHVHSKLPKVLLQVAFTWQSSIPVTHSSVSMKNNCMVSIDFYKHPDFNCIPVHANPFPVNPVLHTQL